MDVATFSGGKAIHHCLPQHSTMTIHLMRCDMKTIEQIREDHRNRYAKKQLLPVITASRLQELLVYCCETGIFTYKVARGKYKAGQVAGTICADRGVDICVDGRLYRGHRLAWLYMTNEWPKFEIDHIDINPSNNKWGNLRDVTSTVNKQNKSAVLGNKKYSKLLGAYWCKQGKFWKSSIRINGKVKNLGVYKSDSDAHDAYIAAKRQFHEGCTI